MRPAARFRGLLSLAFSALLPLAVLVSCASRPADGGVPPAAAADIDACCTTVERAPTLLVAVMDPLAPVVGRIIGRTVWRDGKLADDADAQALVLSRLKPLDIVLVSHKGRLSNHTLPGYFSHAAVYLGTEKQFRTVGVWDDPAIAPHREAIARGQIFIEADQKGVHLSDAETVLGVDRLAVLRPHLPRGSRRREAMVDYLKAVGRPFDFHMDAATEDCVFCTELIAQVLPELALPSRRAYLRDVIVPDELAKIAVTGGNLDLVLFIRATDDGWEQPGKAALGEGLTESWAGR